MIAAVAAVIAQVAEAEILPRFRCLSAGQIREKSPGQLVTDADVAAEAALGPLLCALLPGAVVGEEAVAANPALLTALERPGPVWVIDPVDGTANFARGDSRFAVIVALVVDQVTRMGWIYDPLTQRTVHAELGGGAWEGVNRLTIGKAKPLCDMKGSIRRGAPLTRRIAWGGRRGSAAHDYLDLAFGRLDFAVYHDLHPWDHAAGALIHAEAGGWPGLVGGASYQPRSLPDATLLLAPDRESWDQLAPLLG